MLYSPEDLSCICKWSCNIRACASQLITNTIASCMSRTRYLFRPSLRKGIPCSSQTDLKILSTNWTVFALDRFIWTTFATTASLYCYPISTALIHPRQALHPPAFCNWKSELGICNRYSPVCNKSRLGTAIEILIRGVTQNWRSRQPTGLFQIHQLFSEKR